MATVITTARRRQPRRNRDRPHPTGRNTIAAFSSGRPAKNATSMWMAAAPPPNRYRNVTRRRSQGSDGRGWPGTGSAYTGLAMSSIQVRPCSAEEVAPFRTRHRQEMNCQIVHDSIHRRPGWTTSYLLEVAGSPAGFVTVLTS